MIIQIANRFRLTIKGKTWTGFFNHNTSKSPETWFLGLARERNIKASIINSTEGVIRPSDRVRGCGTAQFGQTRTITHNSQNPAKSRTTLKDLLKYLMKSGILLITKIPKNFLGYFQAIYLPKQSRNRFPRSLEQM